MVDQSCSINLAIGADRKTLETGRQMDKFTDWLKCDPVSVSPQVKKANEDGRYHDAKTAAEYALCFNVVAIVFHILLVLIVIATVLVLHFVFEIFS